MGLERLAERSAAAQAEALRACVPDPVIASLAKLGGATTTGGVADASFRGGIDPRTGEAHVRVPAAAVGRDYALRLDLADAGGGQLELGLVVVNDLAAPRFDIDVDASGRPTLLGTAVRNVPEELRAMEAGLGPCQVRRGLRCLGDLIARLEAFASGLGFVAVQLEPLTYHNAVSYERRGFAYLMGGRRMRAIDAAFAPGGSLRRACDGSTPFRRPGLADTPRGRSWAIHDGVLAELDGDPGFHCEMVKVIGQDAGARTYLAAGAAK